MQILHLKNVPVWEYLTFDWFDMISRIKEIIAYYSLSNRAFAIKCGLKDNTFINQLNGVREVSLNTINAILLSFEDISAEWLLRGKGQMLLS